MTSSAGGITTASVLGQGFRFSAACIPNPTAAPSSPFEGRALRDRLAMLASALAVNQPTIVVPVPPAATCGLIQGTIAPGGVITRVRTQFCYGPSGYLIVETTTDGSGGADEAASAVLAAIALRAENLPKIDDNLSPVTK